MEHSDRHVRRGGAGVSGRTMLSAAVVSVMAVGFDPVGGRWVSSAAAASGPSFHNVPPLDGTRLLDSATRHEDARDNGKIIERVPSAVLRPGSATDIATMIRFCRKLGIQVATRGQAHSTQGQDLVGGLHIESRSLRTSHSISTDSTEVDARVFVAGPAARRRRARPDPTRTHQIYRPIGQRHWRAQHPRRPDRPGARSCPRRPRRDAAVIDVNRRGRRPGRFWPPPVDL